MIAINTHTTKHGKIKNTSDIANNLFDYFNKIIGKKNKITYYIKQQLDEKEAELHGAKSRPSTKSKCTTNQLKKEINFLKYLSKNNYKNTKLLITSKPITLEKIAARIFATFGCDLFYSTALKDGKIIHKKTAFSELLLDKIFTYAKFRQSQHCKDMLEDIGFSDARCPYCNDTKISVIAKPDSNDGHHAYLDLDHFLSQSRHPFLAISFYNLIPCCGNCNSVDKGSAQFSLATHINPHSTSFEKNYVFSIDVSTIISDNPVINCTKKASNRLNDRTPEAFNIINKHNTNSTKKSAKYIYNMFQKYSSQIKNDSSLFEAKDLAEILSAKVPFKECDILLYEQGKLCRDITMDFDINHFFNYQADY